MSDTKNLTIFVTWGTGRGKTSISAFDNALMKAGIANYNLIYLSSIIPTGSVVQKILKQKFIKPQDSSEAITFGNNPKALTTAQFTKLVTKPILVPEVPAEEYGKKLYVVMSRCDQEICGKEAWAGLGWMQDNSGRGFFVEHKGENKDTVIKLIQDSLDDMKKIRPSQYGPMQYSIVGIKCINKPVCAIVAAVYGSEKW